MSRRIRTVKPEWLDDERMSESSSDARVLSICLITLADDSGRGRMNRAMVTQCFPACPEVFNDAFAALEGWFVRRYEVRGQGYFEILNWSQHQRVDKPSKPRTPEPPPRETLATPSGDTREDSRDTREDLPDPAIDSQVSYTSRDPRETPARVPGGTGTWTTTGTVERERPRGRVASSLPELPDPLSEHETVSSEEYPWRAFRAKGAELGLVVEPRPSMRDRGHAQSIEHAALHAASLAHERMGFDIEGAYVRLVWLAMTEYAKRRAARPERNPWKLGFVASAWAELTAGAIPAEAAE